MGSSSGAVHQSDIYTPFNFSTAGPFNAIVTGPGHVGILIVGLGNTAGMNINLYDNTTAGSNLIMSMRPNGTQGFNTPIYCKFTNGLSIDITGVLGTYFATVTYRTGE